MRKRLDEVAEVTKLAGFEFTKYMKYIDDGEIIAVRALNLKGGRLVLDNVKRISKDVSEELPRSQLHKYDIVLSYTGTIGESAQIMDEGKFHLAPNVAKVVPNPELIDPKYLFQYIRSCEFKQQMSNYAHGSTQPTIPMATIRELTVPVYGLEVERKIARILDTIDKKIENNMEVNENLLQQACAVFDRFYEESPNQQLFTSLINVLGGGTPKTGNPDFWDGHIPFFTPKDVGAPYTFQTEKYITESGLAHCNSRLYPINTTFVTARGTVGKVSLAGTPMAMNQSCYALASETVDPLLVYFYVLKAVTSLKHKASGAVFDAIVTRDFDSETINILSDDDAKSVLAIIKPMMEIIHNNIEENIRLAALRDSLLPRLMSGELDVSALDL